MTHHEHQHGHDHDHHHHQHQKKGLHKDWRAWLVVGLMLVAMAIYVLSDNEALRPAVEPAPRCPPPRLRPRQTS